METFENEKAAAPGVAAEPRAAGEGVDARAIREGLGLSQSAFAARFGLRAKAVRNREQGRTQLDEPAWVLLRMIIARDAKAVERALAAG